MKLPHRGLLPLAVGMTLAACASAPATPPVPRYTVADFLANTEMAGASFAPDNTTILASSDASGIYNVYAFPVAGGPPEQLTHSTTESLIAIGYFPTDKRFLYTADRGGNELHHIYVQELDSTTRDLTPGDKHRAQFVGWAHDGRSFFVTTNERDARFMDLYQFDAKTYRRHKVFENHEGFDVALVSPDQRTAVLVKTYSNTNTDLYVVDLQSGKTRNLTAHNGEVMHGAAAFSVDGRHLYYLTDAAGEFVQLARMHLASGRTTHVIKTDWDVMYASRSHGGKYLVVGINNDSRTELRLYTADDLQPVALPTVPNADITSVRISRDEQWIAYYVSSSRTPRDLFAMKLGDTTPLQLTQTLNPKIKPEHLVESKVVRFASYDGLQVPGILYMPHGATAAAQVPALVLVHGGPGDQARVGYDSLIQCLVNHGYAVYDINNRGSSGYGKTFFSLDDRRHGEADLGDVVASKRMLIETGLIDPARIGIIGGSYGGYMVLAAQAFRPGEFAVGVDIFGVANWLRTLESMPPYWESFRLAIYKELGDPVADRERLTRISPLFHAKNIRQPLLVLQGANDPRVLKIESDEIVAAVKANGVPVEYLVFDDEGHGFSKKANQQRAWQAILDFLGRYL